MTRETEGVSRRELLQLGLVGLLSAIAGYYTEHSGGAGEAGAAVLPVGATDDTDSVTVGDVTLYIVDDGSPTIRTYPALVLDTSNHGWELIEDEHSNMVEKYSLDGNESGGELIAAETLKKARDAIDRYPALVVSRTQNKIELVEGA